MGDAGEGLIDAEARIQERMEELEQERRPKRPKTVKYPEQVRELASLKLARTDLERQLAATSHVGRQAQLTQAVQELGRRIVAVSALLDS